MDGQTDRLLDAGRWTTDAGQRTPEHWPILRAHPEPKFKMSQYPDHSRTVSLKLSEVLSDIGVNEEIILKRRRAWLLRETIMTSILCRNSSTYYFGSQTEGSTTMGLHSDMDTLICMNRYNVIHERREWQSGKYNLCTFKDETTSPGYCLLQDLHEHGHVLLKNTDFKGVNIAGLSVINGPANSIQGQPGFVDHDVVAAFHCKSWPIEAQPWLRRQGIGRWPTDDMKLYCETSGYFVVPVSGKNGQYEKDEWRISTSQAERCLMFSLNITQIRCYILMKMILKTFINPQCEGVLSSFMCKTVLLYCIQNTHSNIWQRSNLLACLVYCLKALQSFVRERNCPHFIIPENNLMAGRISPQNKHKILEILENIIQSEGCKLLEIPTDDLGTRLHVTLNKDETLHYYRTPAEMYTFISTELLNIVPSQISYSHRFQLKEIMHGGNQIVHGRLKELMSTYARKYREIGVNRLQKSAFKLIAPVLSATLGSVIASHDIYTSHRISPEAMAWFSVGLNSDVSSGRLKLASALYCVGDMERAEVVLGNTEERYDLNTVEPCCRCYLHVTKCPRQGFMNKCSTGDEELVKHITSFCVRFLPCEISCVPVELQYEMFRSTQEDMLERDNISDCWMDLAVVDSLPYLYFLQYKTHGALRRLADQKRALANLITTIETESNLAHRETALNVLGQCMEQESRYNDALRCYMLSLNIRARNNAANFLVCRLLYVLVNMQQTALN